MTTQTPIPMKFEMPTTSAELVSKISDMNLLEKYVINSSDKEQVTSTIPYMDPSTIDLQLLVDSELELQKFESLLGSWGCFQVVNHGIPSSKLDQIRQLCKDFFKLPLEEKKKYARVPGRIEGWGGDSMSEDQNFNWNDRLLLRVFPLESRSPMFWPDESLPKFSEIVEEYGVEIGRIRDVLFRAISKVLKLEDDNLLTKYAKEGITLLRFNCYPPCPYPDKVYGLKPHSDVHLMTFLLQDEEVDGLQVEKDGQWFKVPIVPGAIILNVADMLEIMSNGRIKSVFHKAVVDGMRERMSIGFSVGPPRGTEVGPLKELITEETPRLYKSDKNYVNTAADNYALGGRSIDTLKISKSSAV